MNGIRLAIEIVSSLTSKSISGFSSCSYRVLISDELKKTSPFER